jgi:hypothetical protein
MQIKKKVSEKERKRKERKKREGKGIKTQEAFNILFYSLI